MENSNTNTVEVPAEVTGPYSPEQMAEMQQAEQQPPAKEDASQEKQPKPQSAAPAQEETEQTISEVAADVQEQRSEVQKVLEASNIKLDNLEDEYLNNGGKLSDESYAALEKAGFSRKVVDTYISGVETANGKVTVMQEREIASIKAVAGGEEAYTTLTDWARANLAPEEINGFNAITATNDPTAIRMAVKGLLAQYHAAEGKDPTYITGSATQATPLDVFNSWAEVTAAMSDPRYSEDEAYRTSVSAKIVRSSI